MTKIFVEEEFDLKEAAAELKLSETQLRRMIKRREIAFIRKGSGRSLIFFSESQLRDWRQRRTVQAAA